MDLVELQKLAGEWREKTYPGSTLQDITQKLAEESGEVNGAAFKSKWAKTELKKNGWLHNLYKEIGDTGLVLASLCQYMEWDLETVIRQRAIEKGMINGH